MPKTEVRSGQIKDATVGRSDLNSTTAGEAVVRKIVAGTNVTISSTGADTGTGDVTINAASGGAGGETKGTGTLDFGNAPVNRAEAQLAVAGQAGIVAGSHIRAWIQGDTQADPNGHSADEHRVEMLRVMASDIIAGTGFTIFGECLLGTTQGKFTVHWSWS